MEEKKSIVIKFAGDSGDGMQLTGVEFTKNSALHGLDIATFPDFPAEIRAPQGTTFGVSGYQLHFSSQEIFTSGDNYDVLVVMNAAALKANLSNLKKRGLLIVNTAGFDEKNLRLSEYKSNPIEDDILSQNYKLISIDITKLTRKELKDFKLSVKEIDRAKNMFVLGLVYWLYNRDIQSTIHFLKKKFSQKPNILEGNLKALKAGYNYGDIAEITAERYQVNKASLPSGTYRNIHGNQALVLGLIAAQKKSNIPLFYASYPITPASDILHEISRYAKSFDIKCVQAEDEIAAVGMAIGASFGGSLGVTATSGPGMSLKAESIGLAVMLELPIVICNIQRAGPSTGMPTKTEQADLMQAIYGRNGESPVVVIAPCSPKDCFTMAYEAYKLAIQYMTPVILLSDGYIANGAEPWKFPKEKDLPPFLDPRLSKTKPQAKEYFPYQRDKNLVRPWIMPGTKGYESRFGGLEKQDITGTVSYDPINHQHMVKTRAKKIQFITNEIPYATIDIGKQEGKLLIVGWGSTYGTIRTVTEKLIKKGYSVSHLHLRYINPFQKGVKELLNQFNHILVPELNNGQLVKLLRNEFSIKIESYNKIQGIPLYVQELENYILITFFNHIK